MSKETIKLAKTYRKLAAKVFTGKPNWSHIEAAYSDLRNSYMDAPQEYKSGFNGFEDFLACNDCVSYRELRAER